MRSSFSLQAATVASILFHGPVLAALGKPVLFQDGLSPHVDASFWNYLRPTQSTHDAWGWGWIPQSCLDNANSNNVSPYDMEVFNVHYTDCGSAWVFCRHHAASLSQIDMIDLFGRLPVHERQWIRHVIAVPGGGSAYMSTADVVFQGPVGTPSVFQHEVGHAVDFYKNAVRSSGTSAFSSAINQDSCVPDAYSNSNEIEDYTQVGVLALYDIVQPGGLDQIGANWRCLSQQKSALDGFQRGDMFPGGTCSRRWADATIVSMGPASGNGRRDIEAVGFEVRGVKPTSQLKEGDPLVAGAPSPVITEPFVYKNLVFSATEKAAAAVRINSWNKNSRRIMKV